MFGAKDLGIGVNWKFRFISQGSTVDPLPCTVFVDTGNQLTYGVIDTHHAASHESSCSAIAANPHFVLNHLMRGLNETYAKGFGFERDEMEFIFCTHEDPDWDSLTSFFLCDYLIREGTLPSFCKYLSESTDEVDQGRSQIGDDPVRPFTLYNAIINNREDWVECQKRAKANDEANWQAVTHQEFSSNAMTMGCELLNLIIDVCSDGNVTGSDFIVPSELDKDFVKLELQHRALFEWSQVSGKHPKVTAIQKLEDEPAPEPETDHHIGVIVARGDHWVEICPDGSDETIRLALANGPKSKEAFLEPITMTGKFEKFSKYADMLLKDKEKFQEDERDLVEKFDLELPTHLAGAKQFYKGKIYEPTKAFAFRKKHPSCQLFKFWVRQQKKYGVMLVPNSIGSTFPGLKSWTISVDPHSKFSLHRLGYVLEQQENKARKGKSERFRSKPARWNDEQYSDNQDPWYDGRDKQFSIVASPISGTDLTYEDIKRVLQSRFHGVNVTTPPGICLYYFFEQKDQQNPGTERIKPLKLIPGSLEFIRRIEFDRLKIDFGAKSEYFSAAIYSSDMTQHGVLEIVVEKLDDGQNLILEELDAIVERVEKEVTTTLLPKIEREYGFENYIWGAQCLKLIELQDLDLNFHDPTKIQLLLEKLCNSTLDREKLQDILSVTRTSSLDLVSGSNTVCLITSEGEEETFRKKVLFYALFLKTAYRRFSERLRQTAEELSTEVTASKFALRYEILEIQKDYAQFLGSFDVSTIELSLDGKVQTFFRQVTSTLGLEEQRKATAEDMQGLADLADSLDQELTKERADKLNGFLAFLGVLSLGEVVFMVFLDHQWRTIEHIFAKWMVFIGLFVVSGLTGLSVWLFLKLRKKKVRKKKVRRQVYGVGPHAPTGSKKRPSWLKIFIASFTVLLIGGFAFMGGQRLTSQIPSEMVFICLFVVSGLTGLSVWLFLKLRKKKVRRQVQTGSKKRPSWLKIFIASFTVLLIGGFAFMGGQRLTIQIPSEMVLVGVSGVAILSSLLIWLFSKWKK